MRRHGCGGLNTNCAAPPVQSRMQCKYTCPFVAIIRYASPLKLIKESEIKKSSVSIFPFVAAITYTLDFIKRLPYEQRYLSCMTFSVYEVVGVTACQDKTRKIRRLKLEELSQNCVQRDQEQKLDLLKVA